MDNNFCKVLIPACGKSERFKEVSTLPKGLLRFQWRCEHKTMIEHTVSRLPDRWQKWVIHTVEDAEKFRSRLPSDFGLMGLRRSAGQADTIFQALSVVLTDEDFVVLNCDNAIDLLDKSIAWMRSWNCAAGAVVFDDAKRSGQYGYVDAYPEFKRGAEKEAVSQYALAGAFYFRSRAVFEHAYRVAIADRKSSKEIYISEIFEHIRGVKIASWIDRSRLYEWGSWVQLQNDASVTIDWSRA